jgi:hypothetical protein
MSKIIQHNIEPGTGIYSTFARLSYEADYAVAEFVDNSTGSFYDHEEELISIYKNKGLDYILNVDILFNNAKEGGLYISDNAFGMDLEDIKRALHFGNIKYDVRKGSRHEFGIGMKTAAIWFGKKWTIETTKYGSSKKYITIFDINKMKNDQPDEIDIVESEAGAEEHYTRLIITDLNNKFKSKKQKQRMKKSLSSMYRRDLNSGKVNIRFGELMKDGKYADADGNAFINFSEIPSFKYELPEIYIENDKKMEMKIEGFCLFEDKKYHFDGFAGIRNIGSRDDAGLALFRNNRIIVGSIETYRPKEIFGSTGDFAYQRVFGEINMDDFPVRQAKDSFDWTNGLEDEFISALGIIMKPIIKQAQILRKKASVTVTPELEEKIIEKDSQKIIEDLGIFLNNEVEIKEASKEQKSVMIDIFKELGESEGQKDTPPIYFHINNKDIFVKTFLIKDTKSDDWIDIKVNMKDNKYAYHLNINLESKFFKPYTGEGEFLRLLIEFSKKILISLIVTHAKTSDGYMKVSDVVKGINEFLKVGEKNNG